MQADREDWRYGTNQCALMVTDADQKPQPNRRGSGALVVRVLHRTTVVIACQIGPCMLHATNIKRCNGGDNDGGGNDSQ